MCSRRVKGRKTEREDQEREEVSLEGRGWSLSVLFCSIYHRLPRFFLDFRDAPTPSFPRPIRRQLEKHTPAVRALPISPLQLCRKPCRWEDALPSIPNRLGPDPNHFSCKPRLTPPGHLPLIPLAPAARSPSFPNPPPRHIPPETKRRQTISPLLTPALPPSPQIPPPLPPPPTADLPPQEKPNSAPHKTPHHSLPPHVGANNA